jgi:hypothetical protein
VSFAPLPRRTGRIAYRRASDRGLWGFEDFAVTLDADGGRTLVAHCEMALGEDHVVRESTLAVDATWNPVDAYVRILNHGRHTGSGWFRFDETEAEAQCQTQAEGRLVQRIAISRPMRGFGIHALMADGWLTATFPYDKGFGHEQFFGRNLVHSLHHLGATGPKLEVTNSGFRYLARETVVVPAGQFECHKVEFLGMTNGHPPYWMWIGTDGDFLYVRGEVAGYMDSVFELEALDGDPLQ